MIRTTLTYAGLVCAVLSLLAWEAIAFWVAPEWADEVSEVCNRAMAKLECFPWQDD